MINYLIVSSPSSVLCGNFNRAKSIDRYEKDCELRDQAHCIVDREPKVTENGSQFCGPIAHQYVDGVEGHGDSAYEDICNCQGSNEEIGGLSNLSLHNKANQDQ